MRYFSVMDRIGVLREASRQVFENVRDMAGTAEAAGDFGVGAGGDVSRNIDIVAERTVIECCKRNNLRCIILGEECGRVELSGDSEGFLIMDAIDGSANAVRGIPFFCCSLAFATEERLSSITEAVVTDLATGDAYWATRGGGAFLNDEPIRVHGTKPVYRMVGINTSGAKPELMRRLQPVFESHHTRHFGANALEMAFFARGLMDVFIDWRDKIRVQDVAAGYFLIREAGGIILDADLRPLDSDLGYSTRLSFIAAANKKVLDEVLLQVGRDAS